jgi:hypothetical protein
VKEIEKEIEKEDETEVERQTGEKMKTMIAN